MWLSFGVTFLTGVIAIQSFSKHRDLLKQVVVEKEHKRVFKAQQQQDNT